MAFDRLNLARVLGETLLDELERWAKITASEDPLSTSCLYLTLGSVLEFVERQRREVSGEILDRANSVVELQRLIDLGSSVDADGGNPTIEIRSLIELDGSDGSPGTTRSLDKVIDWAWSWLADNATEHDEHPEMDEVGRLRTRLVEAEVSLRDNRKGEEG